MKKIQKTKTNSINLFRESRLVCLRRREGGTWDDHTPINTGLGQVDAVLAKFHEKYDPENLNYAEHNINEIVHGVRENVDGVFSDLSVLSGGSILDRRVRSKLADIAEKVPQKYKHIINEEVKRSGRHLETENIARELFTYENIAGANYLTFTRNLEHELRSFGPIGAASFLDSDGRPIDLTSPTAENHFHTAHGGVSGASTEVIIRWHEDDFASIQEKLKRAGMWAHFSNQGSVREFIHTHFRLSVVKQAIAEEKAKLSVDRFSPQMLKIWLDNELTTRALIKDPNPANVNSSRKLIRTESVMGRLEKILFPNILKDMSDSMETRTMLAYLRHKLDDAADKDEIDALLNELSGAAVGMDPTTSDTIESTTKKIADLQSQKLNFSKISEVTTTEFSSIASMESQVERLGTRRDAAKREDRPAIQNEMEALESQINAKYLELTTKIVNVRNILKEAQEADTATPALKNTFEHVLSADDLPNYTSVNKDEIDSFIKDGFPGDYSIGTLKTFIRTFITTFSINNSFQNGLKFLAGKLNSNIETNQTALATTKSKIKPANENVRKMDSRGLLYKLVEYDLKERGVSVDVDIEKEALIGTQSLINVCRNGAIYGDVNKSLAEEINRNPGRVNNADRWFHKLPFFSSSLSGKDAIEQLIYIDPELKMFKEIQVNSTKADLLRMMHRHGEECTPAKLREFAGKIGELIRGFEIKGKKKKIDAKDMPKLERLVHTLGLLEAQFTTDSFIQQVKNQAAIAPENRENTILDLLKQQTKTSQNMDKNVQRLVQNHEAEFKKEFLKENLSKSYNDIMDQLDSQFTFWQKHVTQRKAYTETYTEAFKENNIDPRAVSRGFIKSSRRAKKIGENIFKISPFGWAWYLAAKPLGKGVYRGYEATGELLGEAKDKVSEFSTWQYIKNRWNDGSDPETTAKFKKLAKESPGALAEPFKWIAGAGIYVISRPNVWFKSITKKFSKK